jgi:glutamate--cysteine ligase
VNDLPPLDRTAMCSFFAKRKNPGERLGIEVELGAVDPETGLSRPYEGHRGVRALLEKISQIWTDVRARETLEMRAMDGPPFPAVPAVPAFWSGLTYHVESRVAATELLQGRTPEDYRAAMRQLATSGLAAQYGPHRVADLAVDLVRLARAGLQARVVAGVEQPEVVGYLAPLEEIAETGVTLAEQQAARWINECRMLPCRFVAAMRVPPAGL